VLFGSTRSRYFPFVLVITTVSTVLTIPQDLANIFFRFFSFLYGDTLRNLQYARRVCLHPCIVLLGLTHVDRYT